MKKQKENFKDESLMLQPSYQSVTAGLRHASLNPVLHFGLLIAQICVNIHDYRFDLRQLFEFNMDKVPSTRSEQMEFRCERYTVSLHQLYYIFLFIHTIGFLFQSLVAIDYKFNQRFKFIVSVLNAVFSGFYHIGIILMLARFRLYPQSVTQCMDFYRFGGFRSYSEHKVFGEMKQFCMIEISVFFLNLLALSIWMLRIKGSNSEYLISSKFDGNDYQSVLRILFENVKLYLHDENPLVVNLNNKTWELQIDGKTMKIRPEHLDTFEVEIEMESEFDKVMEMWTKVSPEILNEYRAEYLNQTDIMEISPAKYFSFCVQFVQFFGCVAILLQESAIYDSDLYILIWAQLVYLVIFQLKGFLPFSELYFKVFFATLLGIVIGLTFLVNENDVHIWFQFVQPLYKYWILANFMFILAEIPFGWVFQNKARAFCQNLMLLAIHSAQKNGDIIKFQKEKNKVTEKILSGFKELRNLDSQFTFGKKNAIEKLTFENEISPQKDLEFSPDKKSDKPNSLIKKQVNSAIKQKPNFQNLPSAPEQRQSPQSQKEEEAEIIEMKAMNFIDKIPTESEETFDDCIIPDDDDIEDLPEPGDNNSDRPKRKSILMKDAAQINNQLVNIANGKLKQNQSLFVADQKTKNNRKSNKMFDFDVLEEGGSDDIEIGNQTETVNTQNQLLPDEPLEIQDIGLAADNSNQIRAGNGQVVDLHEDMYTHAVLQLLDDTVSHLQHQNLSSLCLMASFCQNMIFGLFYHRTYHYQPIQPIWSSQDFGFKMLCSFSMHLVVQPDLRASIKLIKYIQNPSVFEHVQSPRILCIFLLLIKFGTGLIAQTLLMLSLSKIVEGNFGADATNLHKMVSSTALALLNLCGFIAVYEIPNLIYHFKIGLKGKANDKNLTLILQSRVLDQQDPLSGSLQRDHGQDIIAKAVHDLLSFVYFTCYSYNWFYFLLVLQTVKGFQIQ